MNLTSSFLALALLGMDDPQPKPDLAPKGSVEIKSEADGQTAPEAAALDRILKRSQELEQGDQSGLAGSALAKLLTRAEEPRTTNGPEAQEVWPMTLLSAIMIGLDNSESVRVVSFGAHTAPLGAVEPWSSKAGAAVQTSDAGPAPIVIARLNADASPWRFKKEVMAHIRSIEQQYSALAFMQVQLLATDRAVRLAEEVFKKERADLHMCRGLVADFAEAAQRLDQFKLDLVTRSSDVITSERQLRNILGLPPGDNRRIIPVTPANEARMGPVWDTCVGEMLEQSPEIIERKTALRCLRDAVAIASAKVPVGPIAAPSVQHGPNTVKDAPSVDPKWTTYFMLPLQGPAAMKDDPETRQQITQKETDLEHTMRQHVHSLARTFLNIDASDKQLRTAKRLKAAAAARLDAQRAYYAEGRITSDRFLDAISQYATAVGTEAQYKATYSTSIVALSEAKGTLLADYGIVVAESKPRKAIAARQPKPDAAVKASALMAPDKSEPVPAPLHELIGLGPMPESASECREAKKAASPTDAAPATKTWTFSFTIGSGPSPIQIKGTISADDHTKAGP
jgi:hypothetical protein